MPETFDTAHTPMDPDPDAQFPEPDALADEALILFGSRPSASEFSSPGLGRQAIGWYNQAIRNFRGIDHDTEADADFQNAAEVAEFYGLGRPRAYFFGDRGTYVFFPDVYKLSRLNGSRVDFLVEHFLVGVGQTIARIQSWFIREGHFVASVHPFVPLHVRQFNDANGDNLVRATFE